MDAKLQAQLYASALKVQQTVSTEGWQDIVNIFNSIADQAEDDLLNNLSENKDVIFGLHKRSLACRSTIAVLFNRVADLQAIAKIPWEEFTVMQQDAETLLPGIEE